MARVLIVDDDPAIRDLLEELLVDEGYDVLLAVDGRMGLELARSELPEIILMDLMLPTLDGGSATRELKSDPKTAFIRVIAMSAGVNLRLQADSLPADAVLSKPFDLDALLAEVLIQLQHVDPVRQ